MNPLVTVAMALTYPQQAELRIEGSLVSVGSSEEIEQVAAYLRANDPAKRAALLEAIRRDRLAFSKGRSTCRTLKIAR